MTTVEIVFLGVYFAVLCVLAVYGSHRYRMAFLYYRHKFKIPTPDGTLRQLPRVTIQLPVFNEMYVVERLIEAVCRIEYPRELLEIQVLDDSTDETCGIARAAVERHRRAGQDITYIHRTNRQGFKAGALENGLQTAKGEYVAVFDADFVPAPDFLQRTVPFFADPRVGMVQVRWGHLNREFSILTQAQSIFLDGHFIIEHTARNRSGCFFNFNGTAGIWRRKAIELSGGWQHDTLTEDTDLSFRAQLMGWKFVYLLDEEAPAEIPVEINAFKAQQRRWAKGVMQVGIKLYPRIWLAPLPFRVKLEMFFRLTGNISYPLMIVASFLQFPLLLVRYNQPFYHLMVLDLPLLFFSSISVVLFYGSAVWYLDKKRAPRLLHLPLVMGLGIGLAFSNARAVLEALLGVKSEFVRTPKYRVEEMTDATWKRKQYKRKRG
ncbi:MAG TPA: cellulose synthase family protein, partial [Myxococcaceae bacterium]|nr:cellulose synthase family protein [Myxococcaceae bacterium]